MQSVLNWYLIAQTTLRLMSILNFVATNVCLKNYTIILIVELEKVKFQFDLG